MQSLPVTTSLSGPSPSILDDGALFLDFDGTLVELAERPDAVVVDDPLHTLLGRLGERLEGRLAIVSGRSVAQLDAFLGATIARAAVVGSHGAEVRLAGGDIARPERPRTLEVAEAAFRDRFAPDSGVVIEVKSLGVALHYRQAPASEADALALVDAYARHDGLEVQRGKMMTELRMAGHDKGTAIAQLVEAPPFLGHVPVFLGDDLTDEPGFVMCARHGGAGILVGAERDTAATYRLNGVAEVRAWLEQVA